MIATHRCTRFLFLVTCLLLLSACVSGSKRSQAPFIVVNGLSLEDQDLTLDLGVRNVNALPLMIEHIEFALRVDETSLAVYKAPSRANVIANGTENLRFDLAATPEGTSLLNRLERGDLADLEYVLDGVLTANEGAQMKVSRSGFIYPVPGRPGHFR
jgi:LEA14-like dessication related protein